MTVDPNLIGAPKAKNAGFADKSRKGADFLYEDEAKFVADQLSKGRSLKTIAAMLGRNEADLKKAQRVTVADNGHQSPERQEIERNREARKQARGESGAPAHSADIVRASKVACWRASPGKSFSRRRRF